MAPHRFGSECDSVDEFVIYHLCDHLNPAERVDPEDDEGNIEYKWRLVDLPDERLEHLVSQMKFRIHEGSGKAYYRIGVRDNGVSHGLTADELLKSIVNLMSMTKQLGAVLSPEAFFRVPDSPDKYTAYLSVTLTPADTPGVFLGRIAVLGEQGCGKTTLIGALTTDELDDGNGALRSRTCKYIHEILNGGLTCAACPYFWHTELGTVEIVDFPGAAKYRKNMLKGLTAKSYDLIIWASETNTPDELYAVVAEGLKIPSVSVSTKRDIQRDNSLSSVTGFGVDRLRRQILDKLISGGGKQSLINGAATTTTTATTVFSVQYLWQKSQVVVGGVLEQGSLVVGNSLSFRSSSCPEFAGICWIKNIRDGQGRNVSSFNYPGQVCSLGLEISSLLDEVGDSPTASPSSPFSKGSRPFAILVTPGAPFRFSDRIRLVTGDNCLVGEGSKCLLYWRGIRTEAMVAAVSGVELELQLLRRAEFFGCDFQVLVEVLPGGSVFAARVAGYVD
jgi:hypothetical protein